MKKYLLEQPENLKKLAMVKLGEWIASQAKKLIPQITELRECDEKLAKTLLSRNLENIRDRLSCNLPGMFFNELANTTIKALSKLCVNMCPNFRKYIVGRMVETLFTRKLTHLNLNENWFLSSIYIKSYKITNLTHLKLTSDNETEIIMFLRELQNLKYLSFSLFSLPNGEINNIIRCIVHHCSMIEELDLSNTVLDINDDTMDLIAQLHNLRILHLSYHASVSLAGMKTLLTSCKNIENLIHGGNQNVIADVLEYIASFEDYAGELFNLKTCNIVSWRQLRLIIQMCPYVQNVTVDRYSGHNDLMLLTGLTNLRELKLIEHDFYVDRVKELLTVIGCKLVHLELSQVNHIDLNALKHISQKCPNLECLTLYRCNFETYTMYVMGAQTAHRDTSSDTFQNLKRLVIWERVRRESMLIRQQMLSFLFSSCWNINFITFSSNCCIPGDFMQDILDINPLTYLKQLEIGRGVEITEVVIDRLIKNCINFPQVKMLEY